MKKLLYILPIILSVAACATHSEDIQPTYGSPLQYQSYSCSQIRAELMNVTHKVNEISGIQDKDASGDAWATGVGILLWPSFFFISHNDRHVQLAELKGQFDALQTIAVQKNCSVVKDIDKAREKSAEK